MFELSHRLIGIYKTANVTQSTPYEYPLFAHPVCSLHIRYCDRQSCSRPDQDRDADNDLDYMTRVLTWGLDDGAYACAFRFSCFCLCFLLPVLLDGVYDMTAL